MKILVTGGTGYIGSHTVVELQQKGHEVIIVDNFSNSNIKVLDNIQKITGKPPIFAEVDLRDKGSVIALFQAYPGIDAVIHFAAFKAVGESVENPLRYYENNLFSLVNLLQSMKQNNVKNIVFSSSCTVYGQPEVLPVTENAPVQEAFSPYGNTKQICEEILKDTVKTSELEVISLRYFNPVGAHESALIGELPLGIPNNLVPFMTQTAIGIRERLRVFGNDYNTPDGFCVRDYIHVVDLAKAHVIAIERLASKLQKSNFEVFNLGTGRGYSVIEVIKAFEKVTGEKLNYEVVDRRPGDVEQVYADTTFANQELGWIAEKSLEEMMATSWKWEQHLAKQKMAV